MTGGDRSRDGFLHRRTFPSPPSRIGDVGRLARLFWAPNAHPAVAVTSEAAPPPGYRTLESYAVVPNARRPRYLLPLRTRAASAHSIRAYGSLRTSGRRVAGAAAAAGLRLGLAQFLLRDRLYVHAGVDVTASELADASLMYHLSLVLSEDRIVGLVSLGGGGPYAKPVIQVLGHSGEPLAFVKVGWDEVTGRLVVNEARALELCARRPLRSLDVPRLLHAGRWHHLELSVASPLPGGVRRFPGDRLPPVEITREICGLTGGDIAPLWESAYAHETRTRAEQGPHLGTRGDARPLPDVLSWLQQRFPDARLELGSWHGDWVPWNLATRNGRIWAWDWEHSGRQAPLGFDVLHFFFQSRVIRDRSSLAEAIARSRMASADPLRRLGIPEELTSLLRALYLVEVALRAEDVLRSGGVPNRALYPAVLDVLSSPEDLVA